MSEILSLLSGGIVGGFIGAFLGGFAKFFWENWLPSQLTWRREQRVEREKLLSQFRDPAIRVASDLQGRVFVILSGNAHYLYLRRNRLKEYYIVSTAFLVAQFFAWVELLRRKTSMLDYSELTTKLEEVTHSFSGGRPGFQVFNLEQREIGERMLVVPANSNLYCVGYADFVENMKADDVPPCFSRLIKITGQMLDDSPSETIRLARIQHSLIELLDFLDPESRWIPKDKRRKIEVLGQLNELRKMKRISLQVYRELINQAVEANLVDEDAVKQNVLDHAPGNE